MRRAAHAAAINRQNVVHYTEPAMRRLVLAYDARHEGAFAGVLRGEDEIELRQVILNHSSTPVSFSQREQM